MITSGFTLPTICGGVVTLGFAPPTTCGAWSCQGLPRLAPFLPNLVLPPCSPFGRALPSITRPPRGQARELVSAPPVPLQAPGPQRPWA